MLIGIFPINGYAVFVIGLFSLVAAWVLAGSKHRSQTTWFLLALFTGPLAVLLLFCFPDADASGALSARVIAPATAIASANEFRKCPFCAEEIRREAIKCKHCGSEVTPEPLPGPVGVSLYDEHPPAPADPDVYVVKSAGNGQAGRMRKR